MFLQNTSWWLLLDSFWCHKFCIVFLLLTYIGLRKTSMIIFFVKTVKCLTIFMKKCYHIYLSEYQIRFWFLTSKQRNTKIILHPWLLGISTCVLSSAGFFIKFLWNLLPDCSTTVINWQFFITYIFCFSLKFGTYYIMGHWGELRMKNASLCLHVHFCHFLLFFTKKFVF